jgi:hypothetical protein
MRTLYSDGNAKPLSGSSPQSIELFRDLPGFGFSYAPDHKTFAYTFEHWPRSSGNFTEQVGLNKFAVYVFDYGAPTGLRLARTTLSGLRHSSRKTETLMKKV